MVILKDNGVEYFSHIQQKVVMVTRGEDIPQADYDAMPGEERYSVLCHFASQGDDPEPEVIS